MKPRLIRADREWLWLYKPPGLPTMPRVADDPGALSLASWLIQAHPEQGEGFPPSFAGGLTHRLDNATSGVVLAARSPEALARAREAFEARALRKRYCFLTRREVPWSQNHVTAPIAHHKRRRDRMVVRRGQRSEHRGQWREADTALRRLGPGRWEAVIVTGCRHQIRVHAAFAGLALAGDRLYGGGPPLTGAPPGADFALHHVGMEGLGVDPPTVAPPGWWSAISPLTTGGGPRG